jgi:hypothetical protein
MLLAVTTTGPGFWAALAASVLSAGILGVLAYGKRAFYREVVGPIQKLERIVKKEKRKRKQFQRDIVSRIEGYEAHASAERAEQVAERERVARREAGG